jgi:hypothetical protein
MPPGAGWALTGWPVIWGGTTTVTTAELLAA